MVGTRHAVSDNKSISGLGMPSPYTPGIRWTKKVKMESRKWKT